LKKYASVTKCHLVLALWQAGQVQKAELSHISYMLQLELHKNRVFFIAWCCINFFSICFIKIDLNAPKILIRCFHSQFQEKLDSMLPITLRET
jgi:hypothetical protein